MPPEVGRPGPHPDPPPDLQDRELPTVEEKGPWFRLHRRANDPLFFGSTGLNRFDAPGGEYGACYLASDPACAFVETYGWTTGVRLVSLAELKSRSLARVEALRPLRMVDLTGPGLARLGADERLAAGEHAVASRWALAFWRQPSRVDGLRYRARHDPSIIAVAVFDRARDALSATSLGSLADPVNLDLLVEVLATYDVGLVGDIT